MTIAQLNAQHQLKLQTSQLSSPLDILRAFDRID